ncbi:MAG: phosphopantetheine-binding protein [Elusimicrobiota bacterium]|nr:phosphopantetheine-binding protein [Elusimicrobiota bacterium]
MTPPEGSSKGRRPDLLKTLVAFFQDGARDGLKVGPDTPLLEWGILDSVRVIELAGLLRAEAGYHLDAASLKKENFKDARAIARLVESGGRPARRKEA